jgi:hypothetical protein
MGGYIDGIFLTQALAGGESSVSAPAALPLGKKSAQYPCIGGWVCPRTGVHDVEKKPLLPRLELGPLGRRTRCQLPYRLHYLSSGHHLQESKGNRA